MSEPGGAWKDCPNCNGSGYEGSTSPTSVIAMLEGKSMFGPQPCPTCAAFRAALDAALMLAATRAGEKFMDMIPWHQNVPLSNAEINISRTEVMNAIRSRPHPAVETGGDLTTEKGGG